jgi:hypothetical protein
MDRISVNHNEFRTVGYEPLELLMEVEFQDGRIYLFSDIPMALYDSFIAADNMSDFYHTHIEDQYAHTRVR